MTYGEIKPFFICLFIIGFYCTGWCGKIVYPWRVTTAIVLPGESFEVWFDAEEGQTVNTVELKGPYNTVCTTKKVMAGNWEYDADSGNTYNTNITVTVPADTPADRYDIVLKTSTGDAISLGGVKVIKEYKDSYYVMHMSDVHRWHKYCQNGEIDKSWVILKDVDAVIKIANIIAPEIFVETGDNIYNPDHHFNDNHHHVDNNPSGDPDMDHDWSIEDSWQEGYPFSPDYLKGTADLNAACFAVAGNHDAPGHNFLGKTVQECAEFYNEYYGVQSFNFKYGNTRFMGVNDGWYSLPYPDWQTNIAKSWISREGAGILQVAFLHVDNFREWDNEFYYPLKDIGASPDLVLCGHNHGNFKNNPHTVDIRAIQYFAPGSKDNPGGQFSLYKIDDTNGTYEPVGDSTGANKALSNTNDHNTLKLKVTYASANDGSVSDNTATVINDFHFPIEGARVRFVMLKGFEYSVSLGEIKQQFDGDMVHIVDVNIDINANSTATIAATKLKSRISN